MLGVLLHMQSTNIGFCSYKIMDSCYIDLDMYLHKPFKKKKKGKQVVPLYFSSGCCGSVVTLCFLVTSLKAL